MPIKTGRIHSHDGALLSQERGSVFAVSGLSAANSAQTVKTPAEPREAARQFRAVGVQYSGAVTKDVTVTLKNDELGAAYSILLATISIVAGTIGAYLPAVPWDLPQGYYVEVVAPASGVGGVTSTVHVLGRVL